MRIGTKKYCEYCGTELERQVVPAKGVNSSLPRYSYDSGERVFFDAEVCPNFCPEDKNHTRVANVEMTSDGKLIYRKK